MMIDDSQYRKVLGSVGLFDASQTYGRLFAKGKDALDLLHRMSSNDMKPLEVTNGQAALTVLTNEKGRFVDLLNVVRDTTGEVLLISGKDKETTVIEWLDKFTIMEDARFERATEGISQFLMCGPDASAILQQYSTENLEAMSPSAAVDMQITGIQATLIRASVARHAWFVLTAKDSSATVWDYLEKEVIVKGGAVFTQDIFEVLRIESGVPEAPNEINDKHNPLETALSASAVSFTKGCYIGQEVIARLDAQGKVQRKLVGLKFGDRIPVVGDRISIVEQAEVSPLGDEIGDVTSIAYSPSYGNIGLGYVRAKYANPGTVVSVKRGEGDIIPATIVTLPFDA